MPPSPGGQESASSGVSSAARTVASSPKISERSCAVSASQYGPVVAKSKSGAEASGSEEASSGSSASSSTGAGGGGVSWPRMRNRTTATTIAATISSGARRLELEGSGDGDGPGASSGPGPRPRPARTLAASFFSMSSTDTARIELVTASRSLIAAASSGTCQITAVRLSGASPSRTACFRLAMRSTTVPFSGFMAGSRTSRSPLCP